VLRLAQSSGESTTTDTIVFLAYGKEIRDFDSLGFGVSAGRSSKNSEWQTVFETYYRWQLTKELVVTPDLQIIFGDDDEGNSKTRVVGGILVGIVF
jgi:carbohydrate-selective porin OprB